MMDYANWDGEEPSNLWNHTVSFSKIDNGGTVSIKDSNNKQILLSEKFFTQADWDYDRRFWVSI